jgi:hypothetical protein
MRFLIAQYSPYLKDPSNLISTVFSYILSLCSSFNTWDQVSHPHKLTGKIIVFYIFKKFRWNLCSGFRNETCGRTNREIDKITPSCIHFTHFLSQSVTNHFHDRPSMNHFHGLQFTIWEPLSPKQLASQLDRSHATQYDGRAVRRHSGALFYSLPKYFQYGIDTSAIQLREIKL